MNALAHLSLVVVRGLFGLVAGFAAMSATSWALMNSLRAVIDSPPCRDVVRGGVALMCADALPGWATVLALVIAVLVGLAAAVATGRLTRGMGASLRQPTEPVSP